MNFHPFFCPDSGNHRPPSGCRPRPNLSLCAKGGFYQSLWVVMGGRLTSLCFPLLTEQLTGCLLTIIWHAALLSYLSTERESNYYSHELYRSKSSGTSPPMKFIHKLNNNMQINWFHPTLSYLWNCFASDHIMILININFLHLGFINLVGFFVS